MTPLHHLVLTWYRRKHWTLGCAQYIAAAGLNDALWMARLNTDYRFNYPLTDHDLKACVQLLNAIPDLRQGFPLVAQSCPVWAKIVARWDDLVALHRAGKVAEVKALLDEMRDAPKWEVRKDEPAPKVESKPVGKVKEAERPRFARPVEKQTAQGNLFGRSK